MTNGKNSCYLLSTFKQNMKLFIGINLFTSQNNLLGQALLSPFSDEATEAQRS